VTAVADTTPPDIAITFPSNNTNTSNTGLDVNYTVDNTAVSCWYSNDSYTINTSLDNCGTNITTVTWAEGKHNVTIWVNDSIGNENSTSVYFTIDTIPPLVQIVYILNNTYTNNVGIDINYTVSDANPAYCWYSNDSYSVNTSLTDCGTNITDVIWTEGTHNVRVYANDSAGNENFSSLFFTIDLIVSDINFTNPTPGNATTQSGNSVYVNVSTNDTNDHSAWIDWNRTLVGWWNFEWINSTNGTIYDNSSYNRPARLINATYNRTVSGIRGQGLEFDGMNYYVNLGTPLSSSNAWTYSLWFYPRSNGTSTSALIGQTNNPAIRWGGPARKVWLFLGWTESPFYKQIGSPDLELNQWYYVVGVINLSDSSNQSMTLYINGNRTNYASWNTGTINKPSTTHYLNIRDSSRAFNGTIDEVMMFNRILSPEEINASYNARLYKLYNNFTNLTAGDYSYKAWVIDAAGNVNSTEEKLVTADTTPPDINFTFPTPANETVTANTSIFINVSTSDASNHSAFIDWNRTLVGWWSFDSMKNSTYVYDNSSYGNNATLIRFPVLTTGNRGQGVKFNGTQSLNGMYVTIPDSNSLEGFTALTLCAWVNPTSIYEDDGAEIIAKTTTAAGASPANPWVLYDLNLYPDATYGISISTGVSGSRVVAQSVSTVSLNTWQHLCGVYNGTTMSLYKNGVKDANFSSTTLAIGSNSIDVRIGAFMAGGILQDIFNGTIDEAMIFSRALTPAEINASYNAGVYKLYKNFTDLTAGNYTYKAWAIDSVGNVNQTEERLVTIGGAANVAPNITAVYNLTGSLNLNEGPFATSFILNFTVYDPNGDWNDSTAKINVSLANEITRENSSCSRYQSSGSYANYTCNITMWWFDGAGNWNITASISDNASLYGMNDSITMYVAATTGFEISPGNLTWNAFPLGSTNQTSNNDPLILNNTGNQPVGDVTGNSNISINATNLLGEIDNSYKLFASNFSVSTATGGVCSGADCVECGGGSAGNLSRGIYANVTSAVLPKGNYTKEDGTGQEQLYFCLRIAGRDLIQQPYSTKGEGLWTIRIFLVAFIPASRRKRKKKMQEDKLLDAMNIIADELKKKYSLNRKELLQALIDELGERYSVGEREILDIVRGEEITIPISIFSKELGGLEAVSKYMKENLGMHYSEIAREVGRDERTIWTSYKKAEEKQKETFKEDKEGISIPISVLKNKELTIFEAVISYLREKEIKYSEIARLLNRDQRNIRTIYIRTADKEKSSVSEASIPERKKVKTILQYDKLLDPLKIIADELRKKYSLSKKELLQTLIDELGNRYSLGEKEILNIMTGRDKSIPISIFSKQLGGLEAVSKYMKENLGMHYSEIAREVGRDERTIWTSYKKAKIKQKEAFKEDKEGISIPISVLKNKELTIFESVISYLRDKVVKYSEIAKLLNRDQRNIWTIYSRTVKKLKK